MQLANSEVKGAKTLMSPVAVAKCSVDDGEWMVPAQLGSTLWCFRVAGRPCAGSMLESGASFS